MRVRLNTDLTYSKGVLNKLRKCIAHALCVGIIMALTVQTSVAQLDGDYFWQPEKSQHKACLHFKSDGTFCSGFSDGWVPSQHNTGRYTLTRGKLDLIYDTPDEFLMDTSSVQGTQPIDDDSITLRLRIIDADSKELIPIAIVLIELNGWCVSSAADFSGNLEQHFLQSESISQIVVFNLGHSPEVLRLRFTKDFEITIELKSSDLIFHPEKYGTKVEYRARLRNDSILRLTSHSSGARGVFDYRRSALSLCECGRE